MSNDWNWNDNDNKSLTVVRQVDAIAIYRNTDDDIVIRQRNDMEEDSVIIFPDSHIDDVIAGLQRVK